MTTQAITQEPKRRSSFPVLAATTVAGAGAGYLSAPAKYKSFEDLIADAAKGDKFDMPAKLAESASDDAKAVYNAAQKAGDAYVADIKGINELFKQGDKTLDSVNVTEVLKKLNLETSTSEQKIAAIVAENIDKFKDGNGAIKTLEGDAGKKIAQELLGDKGTVDQVNTALQGFMGDKEAMEKAVENAKSVVAKTKVADDAVAAAKEGKITKEAAEGLAKAKAAAAEGLEKFGENSKALFGKNVWKGLAWGAAIGAGVGLLYKFFTRNKKEA